MILVTGATGQIGSLVVKHLLNKDIRVRAFVRNKKALENVENPLLEVAIGEFEDTISIEKAIKGVDCIFLVAHDNPNQVKQHENVIRVAEKNSVKRIVKLSAFGASTDSPISLMRWHSETEEQLRDSKMSWTFLRPHLYMQNLLRFGDEVQNNNTLTAPMGIDKYSLIDVRDIAEVAAKVLMEDGHASKIYTLTSPSAHSYTEIVEHLSSILNKNISYNKVSQDQFYHHLLSNGTPSWRAYDLAYISDAYMNGDKSLITNDITNLLNRSARDVQTFLKDHKANFEN